jgi:hypothetical protein
MAICVDVPTDACRSRIGSWCHYRRHGDQRQALVAAATRAGAKFFSLSASLVESALGRSIEPLNNKNR